MTTLAPSISMEKPVSKSIFWICTLFTVLILGRALSNSFFYIFAAIGTLVFLLIRPPHAVLLLLFLLPFAPILKANVNGMSIPAIFFFITVLKLAFSQNKLNGKLLFLLLAFFAYCLFLSGTEQLTTILTMVAGILLLYYLRYEDIDANAAIFCFSAGICLSSVLALFSESLPIVNTFIKESLLKLGENSYGTRFSGLQGNPNYYTMDIIVAIAAIIVLRNSGKTHRMQIPFLAVMSVFGIMSISKSFLVTWLLLLFFWFFLEARQGLGRLTKFIFLIVLLAAVGYTFAYESINLYLFRFTEDQNSLLDATTTGRIHLWKAYWDSFVHNTKILFLGNGLNTMLDIGKGTHNTYIEIIFSLGVVGTVIFFSAVKISMGKVITKPIMWVPVIVLAVRLFAIGILTYDSLWFYFAVLVLLANSQPNAATDA